MLRTYHPDNIAFLVKRAGGPNISTFQVSVSIIDVCTPHNNRIGHRATVSIHEGQEEVKVVVTAQVSWGRNVLIGLTEKVDKLITYMLDKEAQVGNAGYDIGRTVLKKRA